MNRSIRFWLVGLMSFAWLLLQVRTSYKTVEARAALQAYVDAREGDAVCSPDHKAWNTSGAGAFVIAANGGCPACLTVKPFEEEIEDYGRLRKIPAFYVVAMTKENDAMAQELRAAGKSVIRIRTGDFGIASVPTFMRVSDNGTIQAMWTGVVPKDLHDGLLAAITEGRTTRGYDTIPSAELPAFVSNPKYQILAMSEIGLNQTRRAKVIPLRDLAIRAPYELSTKLGVVVDCGSASSALDCQVAATTLARLKFDRVVALGLPGRSTSCL